MRMTRRQAPRQMTPVLQVGDRVHVHAQEGYVSIASEGAHCAQAGRPFVQARLRRRVRSEEW